jgi:hypothetical protein
MASAETLFCGVSIGIISSRLDVGNIAISYKLIYENPSYATQLIIKFLFQFYQLRKSTLTFLKLPVLWAFRIEVPPDHGKVTFLWDSNPEPPANMARCSITRTTELRISSQGLA